MFFEPQNRMVRCVWCENEFSEDKILFDEDTEIEHCPFCGRSGCLMDLDDENENDDK